MDKIQKLRDIRIHLLNLYMECKNQDERDLLQERISSIEQTIEAYRTNYANR